MSDSVLVCRALARIKSRVTPRMFARCCDQARCAGIGVIRYISEQIVRRDDIPAPSGGPKPVRSARFRAAKAASAPIQRPLDGAAVRDSPQGCEFLSSERLMVTDGADVRFWAQMTGSSTEKIARNSKVSRSLL